MSYYSWSDNPQLIGSDIVQALDQDPVVDRAIKSILSTYDHNVSVDEKKKSLTKFGKNSNIGTATPVTIMELAGSETQETMQTTNSIDSIVCDDNTFTGSIKIEGHTISGTDLTFVVQEVTANGHTAVSLPTPLARMTRLQNNSTQSIATNGKLYGYRSAATAVTTGTPATGSAVHAIMDADENRSLKCQTAVSQNDYWIIMEAYAGVLKKQTATVDFRLQVSTEGKVFQTELQFSASNNSGMTFFDLREPLIVPPNSDVRITGVSDVINTGAFAGIIGPLAIIID